MTTNTLIRSRTIQSVLVRQTATGFEQGIAAGAIFITGPLALLLPGQPSVNAGGHPGRSCIIGPCVRRCAAGWLGYPGLRCE